MVNMPAPWSIWAMLGVCVQWVNPLYRSYMSLKLLVSSTYGAIFFGGIPLNIFSSIWHYKAIYWTSFSNMLCSTVVYVFGDSTGKFAVKNWQHPDHTSWAPTSWCSTPCFARSSGQGPAPYRSMELGYQLGRFFFLRALHWINKDT